MRTLPLLGLAVALGAAAALPASGLAAYFQAGPTRHAAPTVPGASCPIFPATNVWNRRVDALPVRANSAAMIRAIGPSTGFHPDFGSYAGYGIPYNVVGSATVKVRVGFGYASESDKGPYPIPLHPRIEGGSDRHILIVSKSECRLYELWNARKTATGWKAGSGAIWSLTSNALRPRGWTSADAAGLPILPGLVRYDEVARGVINHAIRFTAPSTCAGYIYPARHQAGSGSCSLKPPMGLRLRLKAAFPISTLAPQARPIAVAMKRYGIILADNGSAWYLSGASDPRFNDDQLHTLNRITGKDLVAVNTSTLRNG